MSDREYEIRKALADLARVCQETYQTAAQPLIDELVKIEAKKPPKPIIGSDGKMYVYTGPLP